MEFSTGIDMLAVGGADGSLQPLRFRFEDRAQRVRRVRVLEVLACREGEYVSVEAYEFTCRVQEEEREELLTVRYAVRSHRWTLFQIHDA